MGKEVMVGGHPAVEGFGCTDLLGELLKLPDDRMVSCMLQYDIPIGPKRDAIRAVCKTYSQVERVADAPQGLIIDFAGRAEDAMKFFMHIEGMKHEVR